LIRTGKIKEDDLVTELVLKVEDGLAEKFKEISLQKFKGDDALTFEVAFKQLLSKDDLEMLRLEQIVEQIQDEIEAKGGITDEEIDAHIAAYRRQKRETFV
jgi:hypothetical protein